MGKLRYSTLNPSARPLITLTPTPALLDVLDFMQDYDVLPSTYIKASHRWHGTRLILAQLAKAHFVRVPKGYSHINARNRPRPLELTDLGRKALENAGRLRKRDRMNDHFSHAYLRCVVEYSFRKAATEIPSLAYHSEADILAHPDTPPATKGEPNPSWFTIGQHTVRPDALLFGYEYRLGERSAFLFLHGFEADRGTERQQAKDSFTKKTIGKMFEQYAEYFRHGIYKHKYGLSQVSIPIITTSPARMHFMMQTLKDVVPELAIQRRFIFKSVPDFLHDAPLPPATGHMVVEPWIRVDGMFSIIDTLKATAERKER